MAANSLDSEVEEELTCCVCLEMFQEPRMLSCLHTFCTHCLLKLINKDSAIICPSCRAITQVPSRDPKDLPGNFFASNLLSVLCLHKKSLISQLSCNICITEEEAVNCCRECGLFLCELCAQAHQRQKLTWNHTLLSMDEFRSSSPECITTSRLAMCTEHEDEAIKMFCETCTEAVCRDCVILKHRDHSISSLKDALSEAKPHIESLLAETEEFKLNLLKGVTSIEKMKAKVAESSEKQLSEIEELFNKIKNVLERRKLELGEKVMVVKKEKLIKLDQEAEKIKNELISLETCVNFTKHILQRESPLEIMSMNKQITTRLETILSNCQECKSKVSDTMHFQPTHAKVIMQLSNEMGKIALSTICPAQCKVENLPLHNSLKSFNEITKQEFIVHAFDAEGCTIHSGGLGDNLKVTVTRKSTGVAMPGLVHDNNDGTYIASYRVKKPGRYTIDVKINTEHISGSPYNVKVEQGEMRHEELYYLTELDLEYFET